MFGVIALLVIQAAINAGLFLLVRKLDKKVSELSDVIEYHDHELKSSARSFMYVKEAINKLTYKP
jgi:hypothetical protein